MQAYLRTVLSPHRQDFTAVVGQAGEQVAGIYEADYRITSYNVCYTKLLRWAMKRGSAIGPPVV